MVLKIFSENRLCLRCTEGISLDIFLTFRFLYQGIKAVIAESFERIHRSNLVGMGIAPLQFREGQSTESLQLTGREYFSIEFPEDLKPGQELAVQVRVFENRVSLNHDEPPF